jgi:hypothetical protein
VDRVPRPPPYRRGSSPAFSADFRTATARQRSRIRYRLRRPAPRLPGRAIAEEELSGPIGSAVHRRRKRVCRLGCIIRFRAYVVARIARRHQLRSYPAGSIESGQKNHSLPQDGFRWLPTTHRSRRQAAAGFRHFTLHIRGPRSEVATVRRIPLAAARAGEVLHTAAFLPTMLRPWWISGDGQNHSARNLGLLPPPRLTPRSGEARGY